eukprot:m.148903 g.148903  ORF g.148903 m.148903 type:complete len:838 (+) comp17332_c0_seq2:153-2666(+)
MATDPHPQAKRYEADLRARTASSLEELQAALRATISPAEELASTLQDNDIGEQSSPPAAQPAPAPPVTQPAPAAPAAQPAPAPSATGPATTAPQGTPATVVNGDSDAVRPSNALSPQPQRQRQLVSPQVPYRQQPTAVVTPVRSPRYTPQQETRPSTNGQQEQPERIVALEQENAFLSEHVAKLSIVLQRYQDKYPPLPPAHPEDPKPWYADTTVLPPLILEYEAAIQQLEGVVEFYENALESLQKRSEATTNENTKLYDEIGRHLKALAASKEASAKQGTTEPVGYQPETDFRDVEAEEREAQLDLTVQELDLLLRQHTETTARLNVLDAQHRDATNQVLQLQDELTGAHHQLQAATECVKMLESAGEETHKSRLRLRERLNKAESENDTLRGQLRDNCRRLEEATERAALLQSQADTLQTVRHEDALKATESASTTQADMQRYQHEADRLEKQLESLNESYVKLEQAHAELTVKESVATANLSSTKAERDAHAQRAAELASTVEELQMQLSDSKEQAVKFKDLQLQEQHLEFEQRIQVAESEAQQAVRDKGIAEAQKQVLEGDKRELVARLASLEADFSQTCRQFQEKIGTVQDQLASVQRQRDEFECQANTHSTEVKMLQLTVETQKSAHAAAQAAFQKRVRALESQCHTLQREISETAPDTESLGRRLSEQTIQQQKLELRLKQDLDAAVSKHEATKQALEERVDQLEEQLACQARDAESKLHTAEQTADTWKQEATRFADLFDSTVSKLEKQNKVLIERLQQAETLLTGVREANAQLAAELKDSQAREATYASQMAHLLEQQRVAVAEKSELRQQVARVHRQAAGLQLQPQR